MNKRKRRRRTSYPVCVLWSILAIITIYAVVFSIYHDAHLYDYEETVTVFVDKGDTLWSIARPFSEGRDIRKVIDIIQSESDCGSTIYPGDILYIPVFE